MGRTFLCTKKREVTRHFEHGKAPIHSIVISPFGHQQDSIGCLSPSFSQLWATSLSDIIRTKVFYLAAMRAARSCVSDEVPNKKNDQRDRHAKTECNVPVHMALVSLFLARERTGQRKG
jgi:hypothetical protein